MKIICVIAFLLHCYIAIECAVRNAQSECGKQPLILESRIMFGDDTKDGEWPWHVAVFHASARSVENVCGGTLISRRHVLTAAHCVMNKDTKNKLNRNRIFVEVGSFELDLTTLQRHKINAIHIKEEYTCDNHFYDIAVLELDSQIVFNQNVQPACVYLKKELENKTGTVVGFGLTEKDELSLTLKKVQMPVIDVLDCLASNREAFGPTLSRGMFCAGHLNGTGVCNGDSGGGFVIEIDGAWHVAGIVSYTAAREGIGGLCQTHGYAVFTRIVDYLPWLNEVTKLNFAIREEVTTENIDTDYCSAKPANGTQISASEFPANCGKYTPSRIQRGVRAELFEFPWMVALIDKDGVLTYCQGTLIHKRYVLTSAYCSENPKPKKVRLGEYNQEKDPDCNSEQICAPPSRDYDVECIILHQHFNEDTRENDIALVRTKREIEFEDHIKPICLPLTPEVRKMVHSRYLAASWGLEDVLQKASVESVSRERCNRNIYDGELCVGDKDSTNFCYGDWGAPLGNVVQSNGLRFVQFGIVSSSGCGVGSSIATNVNYQIDWIMANMRP